MCIDRGTGSRPRDAQIQVLLARRQVCEQCKWVSLDGKANGPGSLGSFQHVRVEHVFDMPVQEGGKERGEDREEAIP